jgi:hypothetical protein
MIIIDRSAMPSNLLTVSEWRVFAKAVGKRSHNSAARYYAEQNGAGALMLLADDTMVIFTVLNDGKIRRCSHKPGLWRWAA